MSQSPFGHRWVPSSQLPEKTTSLSTVVSFAVAGQQKSWRNQERGSLSRRDLIIPPFQRERSQAAMTTFYLSGLAGAFGQMLIQIIAPKMPAGALRAGGSIDAGKHPRVACSDTPDAHPALRGP